MCPLRLILIFLSATLAGFFLLKKLNSESQEIHDDAVDKSVNSTSESDVSAHDSSSKILSVIRSGFWSCADMASGRYLWKHLVSSSPSKSC